ncbi:MAG: hypothetical protein IPI19_03005 [Ignavibacteriales bacterium]|nr:hypothetical protein [Ignavibacteriales bacterium]
MKNIILVMIFPFLVASPQTSYSDTNISNQPKEVQQSEPSKWYYGGTVGFNFWGDYFYLSVNPLVGYQVSPKFSVGGKVHYSYINDSRSELGDFTSHNYGASIFTRYRPIYQAYLHAEFAYASYENPTSFNISTKSWGSERTWVPFLLLGGGFVQNIGPNASVYAEVLFDVIQDENSPYEDWDPIISVGAGIGF